MRIRLLRHFFVLLLFTLTVHPLISIAAAQAGQAELTGEIRDPSGAVIPDAKITLTRAESKESYASTVGAAGVYTLTGLKPGAYTITVEAQGFKRFVREGVRLATGERVRLDPEMTPGGVDESVTVTGDA